MLQRLLLFTRVDSRLRVVATLTRRVLTHRARVPLQFAPPALLSLSPAGLAGDPAFFPGVAQACYGVLRAEIKEGAAAPAGRARLLPARLTIGEALAGGGNVPPLDTLWLLDPRAFVPGSLRARVPLWEAMLDGAPERETVLRWLRDGPSVVEFAAPFRGRFKGQSYDGSDPLPPPRRFRNSPSVTAPEFIEFVRKEIRDGVASGGMRAVGPVGVAAPPRVVCPLSVEPKKPRLVWDGRYVNLWQDVPKCTFDRLVDLVRAALPDALMTVWDHKSGYFHVPLAPETQQFFGFEFEGVYYVYTVLPFGWAASPLVYQTLARVVSRQLRRWGLADFAYLDDSSTVSPPQLAAAHAYVKGVLLAALGWFVHIAKSELLPAPRQRWLGFEVDLAARVFRVPEDKLAAFLACVDAVLAAGAAVPAQQLRSLAGKCVSLALAVPGALLYTRDMFDALAAADRAGADAVPLTAALRGEVGLWRGLRGWHGTRPWRSERHVWVRMAADASGARWGGWLQVVTPEGASPPVVAGDVWTPAEMPLHIGEKEMLAPAYVLRAALPAWVRDVVVVLSTDNMPVNGLLRSCRAARGPGMRLAQRITFSTALERNLDIQSGWIPSAQNVLADTVSRLPLAGEGVLRRDLFLRLQSSFGAFSLDAMAGAASAQCPRYVSRFATPGAVAADFFAFTGLGQEPAVYVFPPHSLVGPALEYLRESGARGAVVLRGDEMAPWWPVVARLGMPLLLAPAGDAAAVSFPRGEAPPAAAAVAERCPLLAFRFDFRLRS